MLDPTQASRFLDVALDDDLESMPSVIHQQGDMIGHYRLEDQLGEGGFGMVWRASQVEPIQREVALKIVRADMDSAAAITRFRIEREALARMDHHGIARVFEAGATPMGELFFAMELVRGVPITEYCNAQRLSLKQRVALVHQTCRAVEHANQKAVLHRDLKPGNILVADIDGEPAVKIIDFGIAKALTSDVTATRALTQRGLVMGTFDYMAPEQADVGKDADDIRVDVYSLGVILFELITGATPLRSALPDGPSNTMHVMLATIIETMPKRPSLELQKRMQAGASVPTGITVRMAGQLDWAVLKALAKDAKDRYPTAGAFADELKLYLNDLPLSVGTPGLTTRFARLAARHRTQFVIGAFVAVAALISTVVSLWAYSNQSRARKNADDMRQRAEASEVVARMESERANSATDFLASVVRDAAAQVSEGKNAEALRAGLNSGEKLLARFDTMPALQSTIEGRLASAYEAMQDVPKARALRQKQIAELQAHPAPNDGELLDAMIHLAYDYSNSAQHALALPLFNAVADRYEATGRADTAPWFDARYRAAAMLGAMGRQSEAVTAFRALLNRRNGKRYGHEEMTLLQSLAFAEAASGDYDRALQTHRLSVEVAASRSSTHPDRRQAHTLEGLARIEQQSGHLDKACELFDQAIAFFIKDLGEQHPMVGQCMSKAAVCHAEARHFDQALAHAAKAESIADVSGIESRKVACLRERAEILEKAGRSAEALAAFQQYLPRLEQANDDRPGLRIEICLHMAVLHSTLQHHADAMQFADDVWKRLQAMGKPSEELDLWIGALKKLIQIAEAAKTSDPALAGLENLDGWQHQIADLEKLKTAQPALLVP